MSLVGTSKDRLEHTKKLFETLEQLNDTNINNLIDKARNELQVIINELNYFTLDKKYE